MAQFSRYTARYLILALAVILLAAGLRLHGLGDQSLWNDEGASAAMTLRSPAAIVTHSAADIHPPGYYLLLAAWTGLAGRSEFALRALSALESILTVALVIALGRRLGNRPAGLLAAFVLAAHTFAITYAQEARMYAQLGLAATAGMWALAVILAPSDRRRDVQLNVQTRPIWPFLALALINAAGLYTQYAYPLTMIAQGMLFVAVWLPRRERGLLVRYVLANGLTLILFAPWAGQALRQIGGWPNAGTGTDPGTVLSVIGLGITARSGVARSGVAWPILFGALILLAGGLWAARRPLGWLPALWLITTVGGFLLLGLAPDDLKQLVPAASAAALLGGIGAAAFWQAGCFTYRALAVAGTALIGLALIGGLPPLYTDPAFARSDYRAIAARVLADPRPGDAVILDGPGQGEVWSYYASEDGPPVYPLPRGLGGDDAATQAEIETILRDHRRVFALFWGEAERDPRAVVETALDAGAFEVSSTWYGDVRFVIYAAPGTPATAPDAVLDLPFGEHITLEGYALDRADYHPGDALTLSLFWTTDAPPDARYKVFVHLYADPDAPPPAQHDSEPGGGRFPTVDWQPGATVIDRHGLLIPPDLPPGTYTLAIGVYDAANPAARLSSPQGDRVPIASIEVE